MQLIQYRDGQGPTHVAAVETQGAPVRHIEGFDTIYALAQAAIASSHTLADIATAHFGDTSRLTYAQLLAEGRVLTPLTHPDPAHCLVTGTGLTHLGSAATRDAMHQQAEADDKPVSDSMRMFQWGVARGKPAAGEIGAQPEWFYKGNGQIVVAPGSALPSPGFALDAGEEPEIVGLYLIGPDGTPHRLGFAVGNEFSDHVTERQNYLYLAHSKLRACAIGPALNTGPLPADLHGMSRIRRNGNVRWERPFATGEANMCHSIANLEYHHFKYAAHRRPGDVHLHFFGTATLSFADGIRVEAGDSFEIDLPALGAPLINPLNITPDPFQIGGVRAL